MFKRRPVQYLGLILLVLASLAVIFYPIGAKPVEQPYTLRLQAPKAFQALLSASKDKTLKGKTVSDASDAALAAAFPESSGQKLPQGSLTVAPGGKEATIEDTATTRDKAQERAQAIVTALQKPFPGVKIAAQTNQQLAGLPQKPLFPLGSQLAVFPPRVRNGSPVPAVKLGLDLQGGVNLVLQVRRALYSYTFDKALPDAATNQEARDTFLTRVRAALSQAPSAANLSQADVNLVPGTNNALEVRTQARDQNEFNTQKAAITAALASVSGAKFSAGRAQFFQPEGSNGGTSSSEVLNRTVEIVRSRVDRLGVAEPLIQAQPPDRIIVQLPGVNDPQKAVEVVGRTAQLEIRLLPQDIHPQYAPGSDEPIFQDTKSGSIIPSSVVRQRSALIISGSDMKPTSSVGYGQNGQPAVFFELQGAGARRFGQVTAANVNRVMPIFLDERVISAPNINEPITGGSGQISGGFKTIQEGRDLSLLLNSGALPAPIDVVENRTVSASLGTDSLLKSLRAGLIGIIAVGLFMIFWYRLPGLLANIALMVYFVLNLAAFVLVGGTLTLPGIAGFLLAVAISLDTNILVFERLKEEMAVQPNFHAALRAAFSRAWTAILDSHVTTLIAAVVLFYLGTGPVKGFALTLGIGVLLSLFSAISVTRLFMWSIAGLGETNRNLFGRPVARATPVAPVAPPTKTGAR